MVVLVSHSYSGLLLVLVGHIVEVVLLKSMVILAVVGRNYSGLQLELELGRTVVAQMEHSVAAVAAVDYSHYLNRFEAIVDSSVDRIAVEEIALLVKREQVIVVVVHSYFGLQMELELGRTVVEQAALLESMGLLVVLVVHSYSD